MIDFKALPVYRHRDEILKALESSQTIIVESPTGSGKTTQIPLILREAGYDSNGIIGITQPRRIAAWDPAAGGEARQDALPLLRNHGR